MVTEGMPYGYIVPCINDILKNITMVMFSACPDRFLTLLFAHTLNHLFQQPFYTYHLHL